jgi:hypothetical protein
MKTSLRLCALSKLLLGLGCALLFAVTVNAQTNAVYVESNISNPGQNSILGFSNDGFGNLTPLPKSPYLMQGTGWAPQNGTQLAFQQDDDGQVVIDGSGKYLYAVNGRSNTISTFGINADDSLTLLGTPTPSGGTQPVSIGILDGVLSNGNGLMVVVNKSSDPGQPNQKAPNIVSFTVAKSGKLTANAVSKLNYPTGTSPAQVLMGKNKTVIVDEFMAVPSQIGTYRIHSNGTFTPLFSAAVPDGDSLILGLALSPTSNYIYAAIPVEGMLASYSYVPGTGAIQMAAVIPTPAQLPCWLAISKDGTRLYSGDTQSSSISVYDVSNPAAPVYLQQLFLSKVVGNGQPWNVQIDPTGKFLYAITGVGLHAINIQSDGTLVEIATPTLLNVPANTYPYGLASILK